MTASRGINSELPQLRVGLNIHSLHSVCVQGCRLVCCLGLDLHSSRFILRRQKTHLESSWAGLSRTKSYLAGRCAGISDKPLPVKRKKKLHAEFLV